MVLVRPGGPLVLEERPLPEPGAGQVRLRVLACAVCRTDLHVVDGELPDPKLPLILGHQIVGVVEALGDGASRFRPGDRVGVPWLGWTCGTCAFCRSGQENLCPEARFTGYQLDGGYAEACLADERFCFPVPARLANEQAAPLLCAGLIGYRALRMAGEAERIGFYGFGAAAHLLAQVVRHRDQRLYAFVRRGDEAAKRFAEELGASWAGWSDTLPPEPLDASILFAPAGELVPAALAAVRPGGTVVCAGIHMSDIPSFPYRLLWEERSVRSVANLTRADGEEFLALAPRIPVTSRVEIFPLSEAEIALDRLRAGVLRGAAVLRP